MSGQMAVVTSDSGLTANSTEKDGFAHRVELRSKEGGKMVNARNGLSDLT